MLDEQRKLRQEPAALTRKHWPMPVNILFVVVFFALCAAIRSIQPQDLPHG